MQDNAPKHPVNRGSRFIKDFGIYALGNIGMKLITFMLVPLYTYFVDNPGDYGYFDMCLAACFLLMPIMTLQMRDGSYRFLVNNKDEAYRKGLISFVYKALLGNIMLEILIATGMALFYPVRCLWYTVALLVTMSVFEVMIQMIRATNDNRAFVATTLTTSLITPILAVAFVVVMKMGIDGIFLSNILSKVFGLAVGEARTGLFRKYLNLRYADGALGKELLKFSLPMIPTAVCWWLIGSSNRFFIKEFIGLEANGLYAVAARMTTMLHILGTIFHQAWQEHAFKQYNSPDRDSYFSSIFNNFIFFYIISAIAFIFVVKLIFPWLIGPNYQGAINFVYLLTVSTILAGMSSFFDIAYQCAKETKRSMSAVFVNAVAVLALNFILIKPLGVNGVILSIIITYFFYFAYRYYDTRRYFTISVTPRIIVPIALLLACAMPFYWLGNVWLNIACAVVALAISVLSLPRQAKDFFSTMFLSKLHRKKK
ncbi:MAG: lipopolysaccharide biosynthesis protein [Muribaculaceae bacterium]|nr:lipopolysaccharide biosynthesis protein [Muribaculaceae bacterium]